MASLLEPGDAVLRAKFFDSGIKQVAKRLFKFKSVVQVSSTGAWTNFFFREKVGILAAKGTRTVRGIPRNTNFPQATVEWDRITTTIEKYGLEDVIPWEDLISDEINVRERTIIKIGEGVVKAVDDAIWSGFGADTLGSGGAITVSTGIQAFGVGHGFSASIGSWDDSSAAILDNLFRAKQLIGESNYSTERLVALISERDHRSVMKFLTDKGSQFPKISETITETGKKLDLAGIELRVSNSVTASNALILVPQRAATWKQLVPLQTHVEEEKFKNVTVRAVELGVLQVTDPLAAVLITGTQSGAT